MELALTVRVRRRTGQLLLDRQLGRNTLGVGDMDLVVVQTRIVLRDRNQIAALFIGKMQRIVAIHIGIIAGECELPCIERRILIIDGEAIRPCPVFVDNPAIECVFGIVALVDLAVAVIIRFQFVTFAENSALGLNCISRSDYVGIRRFIGEEAGTFFITTVYARKDRLHRIRSVALIARLCFSRLCMRHFHHVFVVRSCAAGQEVGCVTYCCISLTNAVMTERPICGTINRAIRHIPVPIAVDRLQRTFQHAAENFINERVILRIPSAKIQRDNRRAAEHPIKIVNF